MWRSKQGIKLRKVLPGIHDAINMEEDAGKLIHDEWDDTSVDYTNREAASCWWRSGPEPDMRFVGVGRKSDVYLEKLRAPSSTVSGGI